MALGWLGAEKRAAALQKAIFSHPALKDLPSERRLQSRRNWVSLAVASIAHVGVSIVAINRFFSLKAHEADFLCAKTGNSCLHENYWAEPWPAARRSAISWLRPTAGDDWCVSPSPGWPPGFRAVLPDGYFTRQIERLPKYNCTPGKQLIHPERSETGLVDETRAVLEAKDGNIFQNIFLAALARDPYTQFPYVYPLINLPLLVLFGLGQIVVLFRVSRLRGYQWQLPNAESWRGRHT